MIRGKFVCERVVRSEWSKTYSDFKVHLRPVCADGNELSENTKFHTATPSGSIELTVDNVAAQSAFEPGKYYYVDFTPVE